MRLDSILEQIKTSRELQGLTQGGLGRKSGVSLPMIQLIEAGRANPSIGILLKLFQILSLDFSITSERSAQETLGIFFGVLSSDEASSVPEKMNRAKLTQWMRIAASESPSSERVRDAWSAICLAVREYYPTFYRLLEWKGVAAVPSGRVIKLKRLALPVLVEIMNS